MDYWVVGFILWLAIMAILVSMMFVLVLQLGYAMTDAEDVVGWCLRPEFPYNVLCMQLEQEIINEQLLERLKDMNNTTERFNNGK